MYPKLLVAVIALAIIIFSFKIYTYIKYKDDTDEQSNALYNFISSTAMLCVFIFSSYSIYTKIDSLQERLDDIDVKGVSDYIYTRPTYFYKGMGKLTNGRSPFVDDIKKQFRHSIFD
uniref:Uncharacterized protein n=1 Tax=viral metagenome TaxID=1070528 RepID=A0A6C0JBQ3_9ZZZZ